MFTLLLQIILGILTQLVFIDLIKSIFSVNISQSQDIQDQSDNVFFTGSRYPKTSSVESDQSSIQEQEFPLDLSMRSSMSSTSTSENISNPSKFLFPIGSTQRHPMLSSSSSHSYRSLSSESGSKVKYCHCRKVFN